MKEDRVRVTLVPHTHWDREWYEPFAVFSERLVAMMDGLLDLEASGFPHFHLDGQTAMIDDYLERRPERAEEVAGLIRAGGLSAGPWFTQMDEFLTSGESHIRNLETGLTRARELGRALEVGYMPDQFGHIGQMPQILRGSGIERAVVWRGVPRSIDRTAFRWRSPDGSEVRTEYLMHGYFNGGALGNAADPAALARVITQAVDGARPALVSDRVLVMVGYDHSGPDPTLPERLSAAAPRLDGLDVAIGGLADHLDDQEAPDDLPVWSGELRSSARAHLLPNVYSARVRQKRERGRVEALLERYAEPLAALTPGFGQPTDELSRAWTLLLWNGAHDSACGCSHDQVAADVDARFAEARAICEDLVERALTSLGSRVEGGPGVVRFNPSPFERDGVPPLGYAVVPSGGEPALEPQSPAELPDGSGVSVDGSIVRLIDEPDVGDLYNFCPPESGGEPQPAERIRIEGRKVDASWKGLRVLFRVARRVGEPFVRMEGVVHNERPDHRLRLHIRLPQRAMGSTAGAPFELVARPLVGEGSHAEAASATWPARQLAVAAGVAVLHEGVFEYEITGPELALTLLRCVGTISRERLTTRPWAAGPATPTPAAQMIGATAFTLAVWPAAPADPAELLAGWERFALPIVEAPASGGGQLPRTGSLLEVMTGDAQLSGVRRIDGHVDVRLWNPHADRSIGATVAGRPVELGPARIETVALERS